MSGKRSTKYDRASFWYDKIEGSGGIISRIAKKAGCDWHTADKYCNPKTSPFPTVARKYQDEVEEVADLAESKVIEAIKQGDGQMVRYYLSTKARHRGYGEQQTIDLTSGGQPIGIREVIVELPSPPDEEPQSLDEGAQGPDEQESLDDRE